MTAKGNGNTFTIKQVDRSSVHCDIITPSISFKYTSLLLYLSVAGCELIQLSLIMEVSGWLRLSV